MTDDEAQRRKVAQIQQIVSDYPLLIMKSTAPVLDQRGDQLHVNGTANVLRIADRLYAVTAAHVIRHYADPRRPIFLMLPDRAADVPGPWHFRPASRSDAADDLVDVAVCELGLASDPRWEYFLPVTLKNVARSSAETAPGYALAGYPSVAAKPGIAGSIGPDVKRLCTTTTPFVGSTDGLSEFDPHIHLLLAADPETMLGPDGERYRFEAYTGFGVRYPDDLGGISGAGVWTVGRFGENPDDWTCSEPMLIGIETAVYKPRMAIKVTRIEHVMALLTEVYPEISRAFKLWTPGQHRFGD